MMMARLTTLEPHFAPTIRMTKSSGMDKMTSTIRIMTPSTTPPARPAMAPHSVPTIVAIERRPASRSRATPGRRHELAEHVEAGAVGAERVTLHGRRVGS